MVILYSIISPIIVILYNRNDIVSQKYEPEHKNTAKIRVSPAG